MKTIKNKPIPKLQVCAIAFFVAFVSFNSRAQTIARDDNDVSGTVCPNTKVKYKINNIGGYTGCTKTWKATGGTIQGNADLPTVEVKWDDTRGQMTKLELSLTGCGKKIESPTIAPLQELVFSVKDQSWGSYTNSYNIDFCSKAPLRITMPEMNVQGTGQWYRGDKLYVPVKQVQYEWKLPAGWTSATYDGKKAITTSSFIDIIPINCSEPGIVSVVGSITNICNDSSNPPAYSSTASITLSGARPNVTMAPQAGYTGISTACNRTLTTFTATINQRFSCLTGYTWTMPAGWKINSQNGNTVVLQPSGSQADEGVIYATANFACGSKYNSGNYSIRYVGPTIVSSANPICTTSQFSISNSPGVSARWSSSVPSGLSINQSTGFATRVNNFNGSATVSAMLSCGVSLTRNVFVGPPYIQDHAKLDGNLYFGPTNVCPGGHKLELPSFAGTTQVNWNVPWGIQYDLSYAPVLNFYISPQFNAYPVTITASVTNACGTSSSYYYQLSKKTWGCQSLFSFSASPNPANDELTVTAIPLPSTSNLQTLVVPDLKGLMPAAARAVLIDGQGKSVSEGQWVDGKLKLNVRNLKKGSYFLHIFVDGKVHKEQILVE